MNDNNDDDNNKNNFGKRPRKINITVPIKKQKPTDYYDDLNNDLDDFDDYDEFINYNNTNKNEVINKREFVKIEKKISSINDLLELAKIYDGRKDYNLNLACLRMMVNPLEELNNMIGMNKVKKDIVEHVLFYLQNLDDKNSDMLHTVIEGPPGVGKTELGKILAKLYLGMGVLRTNIFKKVSRSDMVGKYLGQTAIKTEELIESCLGGVMFIDEVYSLGNKETKDSFSKEAIDTLNLKLTEHKNEFICIVAGYSRDIEECFFAYNQGLKSRFPIKFTIDPYTPIELFKIFKKIVTDGKWQLDDKIDSSLFKKNYDEFKFFGRDMENLFSKCKRTHSKRIIQNSEAIKKLITIEDLEKGINNFILDR